MKINFSLGSYADLSKKIEVTKKLLLVRAINDDELEQLARDGAEHFYFHRGTNYESFLGNMIIHHGLLRNGTVIVYSPKPEDLAKNNPKRNFDCGDAFVTCVHDFNGSVEVYSLRQESVEVIAEHLTKYLERLALLRSS